MGSCNGNHRRRLWDRCKKKVLKQLSERSTEENKKEFKRKAKTAEIDNGNSPSLPILHEADI